MGIENILDQGYRQTVIEQIKGHENNLRMEVAQEDYDVYSGDIRPYVERNLCRRFTGNFVNELPICSSVNIFKKTVDQKAIVYNTAPERSFQDLSDVQKEVVENVYKDGKVNFQMQESDKLFEMQNNQTHVLIEPRRGKICYKPLKSQQLNVIPSKLDPEVADAYILSAYNKQENNLRTMVGDGINQKIADSDDYKRNVERFIWWSRDYHFVTNGLGEFLLREDVETDDNGNLSITEIANPIAPLMPIVEISNMKDFSYWRDRVCSDADFTIEFNTDLTMSQQIVELQGFSQAYLKAPEDMQPEEIQVGPSKILRLITDPNREGGQDVEYGFATPSSDIGATIDFYGQKLAMSLSSRGIDPSAVSGKTEAEKYTSGTDRLLAQIKNMDAARDAMELYKSAEKEIYTITVEWLNKLMGTDLLDEKYQLPSPIPEANLSIKFAEPSIIMSEIDKLDFAERMREVAGWDEYDAYAYIKEMTREEAIEALDGRVGRKENTGQDEGRTEDISQ